MELTKEYLDEKLSQLVTKTDLDQRLRNFATKQDIEAINRRIDDLPPHQDLERFATKDDLLELATKADLDSVRADIAEVKTLFQRIDRSAYR